MVTILSLLYNKTYGISRQILIVIAYHFVTEKMIDFFELDIDYLKSDES